MYLEPYIPQIQELCKRHKVETLYAFGSVLTNRFTEGSDVDLVVNFKKVPLEEYADNYYDLKFSLQEMLHREIDLLEGQALKNPYFIKELEATKQLVYG